MKILIENGANLKLLDTNIWSPIQQAISKDNLEILRLLIEKGVDVNLIDGEWTPLTRAIDFDKIDMVKILIENGANLNLLGTNIWSSIQQAISKDNLEILRLLIEKGHTV